MSNLYKEIDDFVDALNAKGYNEFAAKIREAKLGGSMASEIMGLVSLELKECSKHLCGQDESLAKTGAVLLGKINEWLSRY